MTMEYPELTYATESLTQEQIVAMAEKQGYEYVTFYDAKTQKTNVYQSKDCKSTKQSLQARYSEEPKQVYISEYTGERHIQRTFADDKGQMVARLSYTKKP